MINNDNSVPITSEVIFDYLLNHKTMLSITLEDGSILTGQVLGRDDVFLVVMEKTVLRMIQIAKISHLQADVSLAIEDLSAHLNSLKAKIVSSANGAINGGTLNNGAANGGPAHGGPLARPDTSSASASKPEEQSTKELFKTRLDQLVRNW